MPSHTPIQATERDTTLTPRQLRSAGFIPATIYGKGFEPRSIQVRAHEFTLLHEKGIREFELTGLKPDLQARAHQVQVNGVTGAVLSIEFLVPAAAEAGKQDKASKKAAPKAEAKAEPEAALTGA